tara:strand:+ start:607 stop:744 length:138 start_codon:yes stop_codon:yes gene_type:complete
MGTLTDTNESFILAVKSAETNKSVVYKVEIMESLKQLSSLLLSKD